MAEEGPAARRAGLLDAERLVVFTDAVVAIALTLLVLPLLEAVPEEGTSVTTVDWLSGHRDQIVALLVSFLVVATSWTVHHRIWTHVAMVDGRLLWLDFAWMASIVFLQIPTALVYALDTDRGIVALYVGTMAAGSFLLTGMALSLDRRPRCQDPDDPPPRHTVAFNLAASGVYLVTWVVAVATVSYIPLALLALIGVIRRVVRRVERDRPA